MATVTTGRRRRRAGRRVGYVVTAAINGVLLWFAHHVLEWGWLPFLTDEFEEILPVVTVSFVAAMVVNGLWLLSDPSWFRHLGQGVLNAISVVVMVRTWQVFPFDFSSEVWEVVARTLLAVGIVGTAVGTAVELVHLVRGDEADVRGDEG